MKRTAIITSFMLAIALCLGMPSSTFGGSVNANRSINSSDMRSSLLTYEVTVTSSGSGSLYWDYNASLDFFGEGGKKKSLNQNCLVESGRIYNFSKIGSRGIIPVADDDWYFSGFTDASGSSINVTSKKIDVIRIKVGDAYQYAFVNSGMTSAALKLLLNVKFGVSRCRTMFSTVAWYPSPSQSDLRAVFLPKEPVSITCPAEIQKTYGDDVFAISAYAEGCTMKFRSSNSKVVAVDKETGLAEITGEGISKIIISTSSSPTKASTSKKIKVIVSPPRVYLSRASKTASKITLSWEPDENCSGYEIQLASDVYFTDDLKAAAVSSASAGQKIITIGSSSKLRAARLVRVRAYKRSCSEKVYGQWSRTLKLD